LEGNREILRTTGTSIFHKRAFKMAGVGGGGKKDRNCEIKDGIGKIVASEGGKVDASLIRQKYKERFGKGIDKSKKIVIFVKQHMSDDFEIIYKGSAAFIKSKTKRKDTTNVELPSGKPSGKDKPKNESHVPVQLHLTSTRSDDEGDAATKPCLPSVIPAVSALPIGAPLPMAAQSTPTLMGTNLSMPTASTLPRNPFRQNAYESDFPVLNAPVANFSSMPYPQSLSQRKGKMFPPDSRHASPSTSAFVKPKLPNDAAVKHEVERIIDELSKNHYVEVDLVQRRLFERFKVNNLKELGHYRKVGDIPGIRDLLRKIREVSNFKLYEMGCLECRGQGMAKKSFSILAKLAISS
jgi:hypothetical protein